MLSNNALVMLCEKGHYWRHIYCCRNVGSRDKTSCKRRPSSSEAVATCACSSSRILISLELRFARSISCVMNSSVIARGKDCLHFNSIARQVENNEKRRLHFSSSHDASESNGTRFSLSGVVCFSTSIQVISAFPSLLRSMSVSSFRYRIVCEERGANNERPVEDRRSIAHAMT